MSTTTLTPSRGAPPGRAVPPWRAWLPEGSLALAVLVVGAAELGRYRLLDLASVGSLVVLGVAAAVLLCRHAPGAALAVVWLTAVVQVMAGVGVLSVELALAVVAYGCARWGHPATVVLAGLSIPAAAGLAAALVLGGAYGLFSGMPFFAQFTDVAYRFSDTLLIGAAVLGMFVLALPWLAGLVVRATARAQRSEVSQGEAEGEAVRARHDAEQAQEIARLRDEQTRLARDVHDVVGHSLAVILAQAESAQYLPDDPAQLKTTLATIATSARGSLGDVRRVLSSTASRATPAPAAGDLASLVDGVRSAGREVVVDEVGTPRPLPPELEVVAHRVLQEMLTNAVKHGDRGGAIHVERHWPAGGVERDLRIEVRNAVPPADETQPLGVAGGGAGADGRSGGGSGEPSGQGVDGMRRRLDSVGGRFDARLRPDAFTATAWVPVSGR